jgi:hypothetical protein
MKPCWLFLLVAAGCTDPSLPIGTNPVPPATRADSFTPGVAQPALSFSAGRRYEAVAALAGVAVGDLDGDGAPDVVASEPDADRIAVWRGAGDGTLRERIDLELGPSPRAVALADMDLDGYLDAVVGFGDGSVRALGGRGDATFARGERFEGAADPAQVAIADLDGDGAPDVAVADAASDGLVVLRGLGNRAFDERVRWDVRPRARAVAAVDLDRDGKVDLVSGGADAVTIRRGLGDCLLAHPAQLKAGARPERLAAGDLDGDGLPDLVVSDADGNQLVSLVQTGRGRFAERARLALGFRPGAVVLADLDGDRVPDAIIAGDAREIAVARGQGDGSFGAVVRLPVESPAEAIAVAPLTTGGRPSVLAATREAMLVFTAN